MCSFGWVFFHACLGLSFMHVLRAESPLEFRYHSNSEISLILNDFESRFPDLVSVYSIGKSVRGRKLEVLKIENGRNGSIFKPHVKYIGNIHGNEVVSRELLLLLIEHLLTSYGSDSIITNLVDSMVIHVLPVMNPDGFEDAVIGTCMASVGRGNANKKDLNRDFPQININKTAEPQVETKAVMDWLRKYPFVLSASLHGGEVVAVYPFDSFNGLGKYDGKAYLAPDNDVLVHLASTYASNHGNMAKKDNCKTKLGPYNNGIVNGNKMYPLKGGMGDYNYIEHGCMEITVEVSCCKYPPERFMKPELEKSWKDNKESLVVFIQQALKGIYGLVTDQLGNIIANARLEIDGRPIAFKSNSNGVFWRILLPGDYKIRVRANGYSDLEQAFTLNESRMYLHLQLAPARKNAHIFVQDADRRSLLSNAVVHVRGPTGFFTLRSQLIFSTYLAPGNYSLTAYRDGYWTRTVDLIINNDIYYIPIVLKDREGNVELHGNSGNQTVYLQALKPDFSPLFDVSLDCRKCNAKFQKFEDTGLYSTFLPVGEYTVTVSANGFNAKTESFSVSESTVFILSTLYPKVS